MMIANPLPPDHDYCRFLPVLLIDQIADIAQLIFGMTFVNVWSQIRQICVIFNHLRLWIAVALSD